MTRTATLAGAEAFVRRDAVAAGPLRVMPTRRQLIGGAGALGLASILPELPAWAQPGAGQAGPVRAGATLPRGGATGTALTLSAAASLSEDYFALSLASFAPATDSIVGYPQNNAFVTESMVVHDGVLSQLYHDWTNQQAWAMTAVSDSSGRAATGVIDAVAGTPLNADNQIQRLHVFYRTASGVTHLRQEHDSTWTNVGDLSWPNAGALQQGQDPDGGLFVYTVNRDGSVSWHSVYCDASGAEQVRGGRVDNVGVAGMVPQIWGARLSIAGTPAGSRDTPSYQVLCIGVATGSFPEVYIRSAAVAGTGIGQTAYAGPITGVPATTKYPSMTIVRAIEHVFAMSEWELPIVILRDGQNQLWSISADNGTWTWQKLFTPAGGSSSSVRVAVGVRALSTAEDDDRAARADKVLDLYCVANSTLNVVHQVATGNPTDDSQRPTFAPAIPLQPGASQVAVSATRGTGGDLVLMNTDGELASLTLVPQTNQSDSGSLVWTSSAIHLPATEVIEVPSYRVEVSVTDADGFLVVGMGLTATASAATMVVAAMGQTYPIGPTTAVTATTNTFGCVTFALPADGMASPSLVVTCKQAASITVYPDSPVHSYLAGAAGLNGLPAFSGDTLRGATVTDQSGATRSLAPTLQSNPTQAASAATTIANASSLGLAGLRTVTAGSASEQPVRRGSRSHPRARTRVLCRPGRRRRRVRHRPRSDAGVGITFDSFLHDCLHAIKTGAAAVTKVVLDAEQSIVSITTDIEALGGQAISFVVHTVQDAAHVLHAVANAIEASVTDFLNWLKAKILSLLTDTIGLANRYSSWVGQGATLLAGQVSDGRKQADAWLAAQKANANQRLQQFASSHGAKPLLRSTSSSVSAPRITQSRRRLLTGREVAGTASDDPSAQPLVSGAQSTHAHWLQEKLAGFLNPAPAPYASSAIDEVLSRFESDLTSAATELLSGFKELAGVLANPATLRQLSIASFVDAIADLVDALFDFAQAVVDFVLDLVAALLSELTAILDAKLGDLPIVGPLLAKLGMPNLALGTLAALVIAFPSIVAYRLTTNGATPSLAIAPTRQAERTPAALLGDSDFHEIARLGTATIILWGALDSLSLERTSLFFSAVDTIAPFIFGGLTFPSTGGAEPYASWPVSSNNSDQLNFISWLLGLTPGVLSGLSLYVARRYSGPENQDIVDSIQTGSSWIVAFCGSMALITGVEATAIQGDPTGWAYDADLLLNLPSMLAPLGAPAVAKATGDASTWILAAALLAEASAGAWAFWESAT